VGDAHLVSVDGEYFGGFVLLHNNRLHDLGAGSRLAT
jgi:hypothetical protein